MEEILGCIKNDTFRTFLVVQWLRLHPSNAECPDLIPGQGTKIMHPIKYSQKKKKRHFRKVTVTANQAVRREKDPTKSAGLFQLTETELKKCRDMLLMVIFRLWVILLCCLTSLLIFKCFTFSTIGFFFFF